ncbi:bacterial regulatory helix-turn-helix, LysR family protein [Xanthomonas citri pv. punicae str. LMG 859]|nr:bacterial regulatory helix-turn-helix, LysR family protein [Xanthomonas citri pv. punicae str. LMG 859]
MNLRPTLLPALGVFAAAARHQNFAHAAEELHLTASAVSHHVRKLEALLGATLFQRLPRGVKLTAEGRQLADAATAALAQRSLRWQATCIHAKTPFHCGSPRCGRCRTAGYCRGCRAFAAPIRISAWTCNRIRRFRVSKKAARTWVFVMAKALGPG